MSITVILLAEGEQSLNEGLTRVSGGRVQACVIGEVNAHRKGCFASAASEPSPHLSSSKIRHDH